MSSIPVLSSGAQNVALGNFTLFETSTGNGNTVAGYFANGTNATGNYNSCFGWQSGIGYVGGESSNILISNPGIPLENNVLRIGNGTGTGAQQLVSAYISGITGSTPIGANSPQIMVCDNTDNVTVLDSGTEGWPLTSGGAAIPIFSPQVVLSLIYDINENPMLEFIPTASAVNYFQMVNDAAGQAVVFRAAGADTDINMTYVAKGVGSHVFGSLATSNQLVLDTGTAYQHTSYLSFPSSAASTTYTFPDATGTVLLSGQNAYIPVILDTNGNAILDFVSQPSPVNYISISNNSTGNAPVIAASGSDANVTLSINATGTGIFEFLTAATTNQVKFNTGTTYQHSTYLNFANTAASRTVTFQDASGTLCQDNSGSGSITTAPPVSSSASLALGTAYQNTSGYDVVVTVYLAVSAATSGSILSGVGTTTTPTQQTIVSSITVAALTIVPVTLYIPAGYYALLSTSGTITATISGQQTMAV